MPLREPLDIRDYPQFRRHFMWRESDDGMLDCVCTKCGWSRQLVANAQGAAGPLHVAMHIGKCCAPPTEDGRR